jgi:hypothetical protein
MVLVDAESVDERSVHPQPRRREYF